MKIGLGSQDKINYFFSLLKHEYPGIGWNCYGLIKQTREKRIRWVGKFLRNFHNSENIQHKFSASLHDTMNLLEETGKILKKCLHWESYVYTA